MKPMLATLAKEAFDSKDWIFETKWDGYRALAHKNHDIKLESRNELSFNKRFPEIVADLKKIPGSFILDGEIVLLDSKGRSQFQLLQNYPRDRIGVLSYYVFDILSYSGNDLTSLPLLDRRKILCHLLKLHPQKTIKLSCSIDTKGKAFFERAKKLGHEGIIAKKKSSIYLPFRTMNWLKIKTSLRQEVVIGGYTEPKGTRKKFGALLVGFYENNHLVYCGHVGGGFNSKSLNDLYSIMYPLRTTHCPFSNPPKPNSPVTWITPQLVCEISFAEWTKDAIMRQPIFKGMRIDELAKEVVKE